MSLPARRSLVDRITYALDHLDELDPAIARAVSNLPAHRSRVELLTRIHRVLAVRAPSLEPETTWRAPIGAMTVAQAENARRAIEDHWPAVASRNVHLAALRAVVRASWEREAIDADTRDRVLLALKMWPHHRNLAEQPGRHITAAEVTEVFAAIAATPGDLAIRDGALLALMLGCGPRRSEVCGITLADWVTNDDGDSILLRDTKGSAGARTVYPPEGTVAWLDRWADVRGDWPGPLFPPAVGRPRTDPVQFAERAMSPSRVFVIVRRWFGEQTTPHDLRRTWIGNELAAGADLSTIQQLAGHRQVTTTAGYDRRREDVKRAANALVEIPGPVVT